MLKIIGDRDNVNKAYLEDEELPVDGYFVFLRLEQIKKLKEYQIPENYTFKLYKRLENDVMILDDVEVVFEKEDDKFTYMIEEMVVRKYWDGLLGLMPLMEAKKQVIENSQKTKLIDYQDDGNYIHFHYEINPKKNNLYENIIEIKRMAKLIEEQAEDIVIEKIKQNRS